jgi:hypothetical protein
MKSFKIEVRRHQISEVALAITNGMPISYRHNSSYVYTGTEEVALFEEVILFEKDDFFYFIFLTMRTMKSIKA